MIPLIVADELRDTITDYLETTFAFRDTEVAAAMKRFLTDPASGIFKGPYFSLRLPFRKGTIQEAESLLDIAPDFGPYKHQLRAFERLTSRNGHTPEPTLVTTGTGSGKTECFLFPILDHCYRHQGRRGIKALILYPMNALAEDQAQRLAQEIWTRPELKGKVTAGVYIGGKSNQKTMGEKQVITNKHTLRENPPDILLTNYKMLDYLLIRPQDQKLWALDDHGNHPLQYIVLDELHTYDGAQGSDVACLIRRLQAKIGATPEDLCFVGTSATLANGEAGRKELVDFASKISASTVDESALITEDRVTIDEFLPATLEFATYPSPDHSMEPANGESADTYLLHEARRWFGETCISGETIERAELGRQVSTHRLLREIVEVVTNHHGPISEIDFDSGLVKVSAHYGGLNQDESRQVIRSFLSLVSYSQVLENDRTGPLLHSQVQMWLRALSRVARTISHSPSFVWIDEAGTTAALPGCYCRECGHSGWISVQNGRDTDSFRGDWRTIQESFFAKKKRVRYIFPASQDDSDTVWLSMPTSDGDITLSVAKPDDPNAILVINPHRTSFQSDTDRDKRRCPNCESDQAMAWLGSAGASLSSVAVSHLFASPFNEDKKLLAFTDSVQDASHRAGFFMGRTFRFNLRTAFQAILESKGTLGVNEFLIEFQRFWMNRFLEELKESELKLPSKRGEDVPPNLTAAAQRFVASFLPPDLLSIKEYSDLIEFNRRPEKAVKTTMDRLRWEAILEYGLNLRVGRTLDKVRCSTLWYEHGVLTEAIETVDSELSERQVWWRLIDEDKKRHFIRGILMRAKRGGALYDPLLDTFIEKNGDRYQLSRRMNRLISPFGEDTPAPRMLVETPGHRVWDSVRSEGSGLTWHLDWARRCLGQSLSRADANDLYSDLLTALVKAKLFKSIPVSTRFAYALNPDLMCFTKDVALVRAEDGDDITIPIWDAENWIGQPTLGYRGKGTYSSEAGKIQSYYRGVYTRGTVRRIHASEHTGLLERRERNKVEQGFRDSTHADSPNLLACTPTLEMGIDVGDLSTTMVCSIPPTTASYLQRIGRAGRKTGNALILAIANPQPHDLYFFSEPEQMLAGNIEPPGCFLDAPEMLKRQFVAFAMDRWASKTDSVLPTSFSSMIQRGSVFPSKFLDDVRTGRGTLISDFLSLFDRSLLPDSSQLRIQEWIERNGVYEAVTNAVEIGKVDLKELRAAEDRLQDALIKLDEALASNQIPVEQHAKDREDILVEKGHIHRRLRVLTGMNTLSFFVEKGVLPNYDLPEDGVKLRVTITNVEGRQQLDGTTIKAPLTLEVVRSAPRALRELVPGAKFYFGMRKLPIDVIDTGGVKKPLIETWRLCNTCGHGIIEETGQPGPQCPRCGNTSWPDSGRLMDMVKHIGAESKVSDAESRNLDETDDREVDPYAIGLYFDIPGNGPQAGYINEAAVFGFEYLQHVTIREINFGELGPMTVQMPQGAVPTSGFSVCKDCGVVNSQNVVHRRRCRLQREPATQAFTDLRLYRQMESEAIRFLLPVSTLNSKGRVANLKSAIELGIRRRFGGKASHLRLAPMVLPSMVDDAGVRNYLVLYDTVIGGTGYLKEFVKKPQAMRQVFDMALSALEDCSCAKDPNRDGCYKCIFAYQNQREREHLSRVEAVGLIKEIIDCWEGLTEVDAIGDYQISDSYLESELEQLFFRSLVDVASEKQEHQIEKSGTKVKFGNRWWEIVLQRALTSQDGVLVMSRPDCILVPLDDDGTLPIAIFVDGFKWHANPDRLSSRLQDDLNKRRSIIESRKYKVVVLTKWDLDEVIDDKVARIGPLEPLPNWDPVAQKISVDPKELRFSVFSRLISQLENPRSHPDRLFDGSIACWTGQEYKVNIEHLKVLLEEFGVGKQPDIPEGQGAYFKPMAFESFFQVGTGFSLGEDRLPVSSIVVWLSDEAKDRAHDEYRKCWHSFWKIWNLLCEFPRYEVVIGDRPGLEVPPLLDLIEASVHGVVRELMLQFGQDPIPGFELVSDEDEVLSMSEAAWPDQKVAVVLDVTHPDVQPFVAAGWKLIDGNGSTPG